MTKVILRIGRLAKLLVILALLLPARIGAQPSVPTQPSQPASAEKIYLQLGSVGLTPSRVYRIRDAAIDRGALHITLDDGTIGFTEDVAGRITGAFFEGDGEVLLQPPDQVERASMAFFTHAAILEEHFVSAYFRFNDATVEELQPSLRSADNPDDFVKRWDPVARNLAQADSLRLLITFSNLPQTSGASSAEDAPPTDRLFHARLQGQRLGTFDLYFDSLAAEQVLAGQLRTVNEVSYFDVWSSFALRTRKKADVEMSALTGEEGKAGAIQISKYKITATITPPKLMEAEADLDIDVHQGGTRTLLLELSRFLQVKSVEADGHALQFIHNPSVEGTRLAVRGNDQLLVIFPRLLRSGERIHLRFEYGGEVLEEAGAGLLYVGARGTWYPNRGLAMADFDLQFHYPPGWALVATGKRVEGAPGSAANFPPGEQSSRWVSERPIPLVGFNLGKYSQISANAGTIPVDAYATAGVEQGFPKPPPEQVFVPGLHTRPGVPEGSYTVTAPPPSPARNAQAVANRAAAAIDFFSQSFGPYPYSKLAITQLPGPLSQGWPGLIFLSSFAFLTAGEKAELHVKQEDVTLSETIIPHETAHEWWGDLVTWTGYRDQWLMEAISNYSALMLLENEDPNKFRQVMAKYRDDLLTRNKQGEVLADVGPVTLGTRLSSSHTPDGYEAISYGRGTWLLHMLRTMIRDETAAQRAHSQQKSKDQPELFLRVLRKIRDQYQGRAISTQEFLRAFSEELPSTVCYEGRKSLDWFYDSWVNGTAVPKFELSNVKYTSKSGASTSVSGVILQKLAPKDLVSSVPIYAVLQGRNVLLGRVFAEGAETPFHISAPAGTRRVVLDADQSLLSRAH